MAKKKVKRKELLKRSDEFLTFSSRAVVFATEHYRHFTYIGIALAVIALIYVGVNTYMGYINKKGQNSYNTAYYTLIKNMNPDADHQELKKTEELFQQVIDKYGLSKASRLALPELAYLKFLGKEYDEAISLYQKFIDEVPDNTPYQSLSKMALAVCYEEKGELKKAMEILEQGMTSSDDHLNQQAMLSLARIYRLTNQQEKSRKILKEFIEKFKTSPFLSLAKAHLK